MLRDVRIEGKYATQVKEIVDEKKLFTSNADLYFLSALIGMYDSKSVDSTEVKEEPAAHVSSRTWLRSRSQFEDLLSIFSKLEEKMQGEPLNIYEIFSNHLNEKDEFEKDFNVQIKNYAYYGIDKLFNSFKLSDGVTSYDFINTQILNDLKKTDDIDLDVQNENFKSIEDISVEVILEEDTF